MAITLQVLYPTEGGTSFDHEYYATKHQELLKKHVGPHLQSAVASRGLAGGAPGSAAPYHAIATLTFADQAAMDAGLKAGAPVVADIPNFYSAEPVMMVGQTIG